MVNKIFHCFLTNIFICFIITYGNFSIQADILETVLGKKNCGWECLQGNKRDKIIEEFKKDKKPVDDYTFIIAAGYTFVITPLYYLVFLKDLSPRDKIEYIIINIVMFLIIGYIFYFQVFPRFIKYM